MTRPDPPGAPPSGYAWEARPDPLFRVTEPPKSCRMRGHGVLPTRSGSVACGKSSVAETLRGNAGWWAYCPEHMYGRWVEDGVVMHWVLVAEAPG